jgi:hypothetical protein
MTKESALVVQAREAIKRIKDTHPGEFKAIGDAFAAILNQNTIALGDGQAFALRDESGRIIATKQIIRLTGQDGTLTQPVFNGPWVVSAFGYKKLADAAGAVVMNAQTVIVDGVEQPNPFIRRDQDGNAVEVYCRAVAFRYGEAGQAQVSDRTTIFDLRTYLKADMIGKAKKQKQCFRIGAKGKAPDGWIEYPVDGFVSLYMDPSHEEVISFMGQVLNRQKKALEFAQTFAQRNALKHLFGIDKAPAGQSHFDMPVYCWKPENGGLVSFSLARYQQASNTLHAVTSGNQAALPEPAKAAVIELNKGTDIITEEHDIMDGADVEDQMPEAEVAPAPSPMNATEQMDPLPEAEPEPDPVREKAAPTKTLLNARVAESEFAQEAMQAKADLAIDTLDNENAAAFIRRVNEILDGE